MLITRLHRGGTAKPLKGRILSEAERRQADYQVATGDLISRTQQLLANDSPAMDAAKRITEFDSQIQEVQSKRLELLPSQKEALEASLEAERKINTERDKDVKILTVYQQELQAAQAANKKNRERLQEGYLAGEIKEGVYQSSKTSLLREESATAEKLEKINKILSSVTNTLSVFQKQLRNSTERINNFIERRGREAQGERTEIITEGLELAKGDRVIQLELDAASRSELNDYVSELEKTIEQSQNRLNSGALAEGYRLVRQSAAANGLTLDSATVERMLGEEGRSQGERDALGELKSLLNDQSRLAGYQEQLAQNLQASRNALIDFNRTIADYFFRINQQIKEAQIEVLRIVNQIVQTSIKNKLQAALSPNAESFVNQLISSTQSLLDQAASYAEKALGQRGARIQFAGQKRTLLMELQDFARNVSGASDALLKFEQRLRGGGSTSTSSAPSNNSNFTAKTKDIANRLGIDPHALMTIMLFESAGTLSPKIQGPEVKNQGRGRGLIQFMPATARRLGTSDAELAAMTDVEQLDWVEKYFAQFKGNFGSGKLENLYAAVLAGNPLKVNASDGYTTAKEGAKRMMSEYGAKATSLLEQSTKPSTPNNILNVPSVPSFSSSGTLPPPPEIETAQKDTEFLIDKEEQKLDLQDSLIQNQEKETLQINLDNAFATDRRRVENEIKQRQFELDDSIYAQFDLLTQFDYQTADTEAASSVRGVNKAFSDRGREVMRQAQFYSDEIDALKEVIGQTDSLIALAQTEEERRIIRENDANAKLLLPVYEENLAALTKQEQELLLAAQKALNFVGKQNKLKKEQEGITKRITLLNQKDAITQARGTLEEQRQVRLKLEQARLDKAISDIKLSTPPGKYRKKQISNERKQSKINQENINFDTQAGELDKDRRLIDLQASIDDKEAGFLSRYGFNLQADKLRKDSAITQENNRFQKELVQIQKEFKGQPALLAEFTEKAKELNRVNLEAINQQFKGLGQTIEDYFITSTQGFFNKFVASGFDFAANREKAQLEERLRYAEELVGLENQYREEPGKLAYLKNRARELNEEKLDKIRGEFNLFSRTVDLAKQALLEFVKQLAAMVAQQAAAKFISSLFGSALGSSLGSSAIKVGNDYGSGAGAAAFTADEGITVGDVPNYRTGGNIKSRKLSDAITNSMRDRFPGINRAWKAEGEGAQLGVFHIGEELLSRKTGEAGRYQALKRIYGVNPLDKILTDISRGAERVPRVLNYNEGGTIGDVGSSVLSGFSSSRPRIDLSGLNTVRGQAEKSRSVTVNTTVVTPNADSFRLNQDQMNQDLVERMRRGI